VFDCVILTLKYEEKNNKIPFFNYDNATTAYSQSTTYRSFNYDSIVLLNILLVFDLND